MRAVIDEELDEDAGFSMWTETLRAWISMMVGYLEINNDAVDDCLDKPGCGME